MQQREGAASSVVEMVHVRKEVGEDQPRAIFDQIGMLFDGEDLSVPTSSP